MESRIARVVAAGLPSPETWRTMIDMAKALFDSGLLPKHIQSPQAAVAIIQKGAELGVPPMHALSNIVVIQGKPTCNAELMLALIYRDHGDQAVFWTDASETVADMRYARRGVAHHIAYRFTIEDARRAGLTDGPNSANWKKYPAAMLRARCISAVARMAFPDTIGGMYSPDELGAAVMVDADGSVVLDDREHLSIPAESPRTVHEATVIDGNVVTDDGEIMELEEAQPSIELLLAELQRRLRGAHSVKDLRAVREWSDRVGLRAIDEAKAAFNERVEEVRAAGSRTASLEQPALVN